MEKINKISARNWVIIWIAGLAGQLCWNIENQWFNTFVYAKVAPDPGIITWMVAVSAIVTTLSTFISGTGSDRLGKRKPFIVVGYILWGVFTIVFGAIEFLPKSNIMVLASMVVIADAIMSFFGSLGNDAGFNPWTTDISNENNRGGLGAVVAVQPVIATIVGSLIGGIIITALGYFAFFVIMGAFVSLIGVYSAFALKDSPDLKPSVDPKGYFHQFGQAFNFKLLAKNKMLLLVLFIFAMFFISFNVYFPHLMNYFIYTRGYDEGISGLLLGIGLIIAIPFTLIAGRFINKKKYVPVVGIALIGNIIGLFIMVLSEFVGSGDFINKFVIVIAIIFVGGGYMVIYQSLMMWCKNLYPEEQRGQLEGVRLFFYVCIPMVLGPAIANPVIENLGQAITLYYDGVGVPGFTPSKEIFYIAAAVAVLTFIPLLFAYLHDKKERVVIAENQVEE
ncbi:MAG: MFS transporter [Christensenellales bacterium]|jgi:MFS family permease|nr:MFS transporter [Eubacteriales bacterium]